jgi:hypothetical protein
MKATQRPIRLSALIPAFACALLLTGCWNGRILFTLEEPFWSSIGGDARLGAALAGVAALHGYFPRVVIEPAGTDPLAALAAGLDPGRHAAVVVGPLLSFQWEGFVAKYPRTRFVLIDAPPPGQDPPNAVFLTFDRTGAFRDAGRAAGADVRKRFGAADASVLGPRIAVLTSVDSDLSPGEVDSFTRGVAEALDGGRPESRLLPAPADAGAISAAVDQLRRAGVETFLLGLGERNPAGLEALRGAGGAAVLADWRASGAFSAQVLLSVEEDVPGGITRALNVLRTGVTRVQGPVRLVSGKKI